MIYICYSCSEIDEEDLAKVTATHKLQEDHGNRLISRRRCRIDFERSVSGDVASSFIMNNDLSRTIRKEPKHEIKAEEENTETYLQGIEYFL